MIPFNKKKNEQNNFQKVAQFVGTSTTSSTTDASNKNFTIDWGNYSEFLLILSTIDSMTRVLGSITIPKSVALSSIGVYNGNGTHQCNYSVSGAVVGVDFINSNTIRLNSNNKNIRAELWAR